MYTIYYKYFLIIVLCSSCLFASNEKSKCINHLFYRTIDGSCNNMMVKDLGQSRSSFLVNDEMFEYYPWAHVPQIVPAITYSDYLNNRSIIDDGPRGNARKISNIVSQEINMNRESPEKYSIFGTLFGQFVSHDIEDNMFLNNDEIFTQPLVSYIEEQDDPSCQENNNRDYPHTYRCNDDDPMIRIQIKFSANKDGVYETSESFRAGNDATAYFDLDTIYGRNDENSKKLRAGTGGKLLHIDSAERTVYDSTQTPHQFIIENTLPTHDMADVPVQAVYPFLGDPTEYFVSGDARVNENMGLTIMHTIFMREHNRLCDIVLSRNLLFRLFPRLFDEKIFNTARALNIARYQHIIYKEFLPTLLGYNVVAHYNDTPKFYQHDPSTSLEFASGAFRYGHFTLKSYYALDECGNAIVDGDISTEKQIYIGSQNPLPKDMNSISRIFSCGSQENMIRGMINEKANINGLEMDKTLKDLHTNWGSVDMTTYDIIRARHNGVAPYIAIRKQYRDGGDNKDEIYGLNGCPEHFKDKDHVDDPLPCFDYITNNKTKAKILRESYGKIKWIDLIVGLQSEEHRNDVEMGHTSYNIILNEFLRKRQYDRFFYDKGKPIHLATYWDLFPSHADEPLMKQLLLDNFDLKNHHVPYNPFVSPEHYRETLESMCDN